MIGPLPANTVPRPDPDAPTTRLELDRAAIKEGAPLREIAHSHWAAV